MKLTVSKRILHSGDVVEVSWDAEGTDSPRLVMHSGQRETILAVPDRGTKRFRMKNNGGAHFIGFRAYDYGKEKNIRRWLFVYGSGERTDEFEYVDRGASSPFGRWNGGSRYNAGSQWNGNGWMAVVRRWWAAFPPDKKQLYILLLLLLAYQLLMSFFPQESRLLLYGIIIWLFFKVIR